MQTRFETTPVAEVAAGALIVPAFENEAPTTAAREWAAAAYASGEFKGKPLEIAVLHNPPGLRAGRLALVGCGQRDKFDAAVLRRATGAATRHLKTRAAKHVAVALESPDAAQVAAAIEGVILGDYEPDRYKTDPERGARRLESAAVVVPGGGADLAAAFERGRVVADSQNWTRELVNEPANRLTPSALAMRASAMAAECGLDCEILDRDRMAQLGMGSLLGVAQGSDEPPALIVIRYRPADGATGGDHLGLVGKGVTFDTGGISIKPADGMEKMKYDMAGAAAVLGAMRAIAALKPRLPVTALAPCVENMPGSRAQRPGDIVTALSGKTIEVLNTDAEGRLILADALTYAQRIGCTHLVNAATLTGAIVVALGHVHIGAFTNNQTMLDRVLAAARAESERMWPMPLDDDYKEYLKSAFADLGNVGGRWGGAITAAWFLKEFADPAPWVHLDIAGTAWLDDEKPFLAKGPSGVAVRTFVRLATDWPS
jgi:leucyl aminopeptidase